MTRLIPGALLVGMALTAGGCGGPPPPQAPATAPPDPGASAAADTAPAPAADAGITARTLLDAAIAAARQWQADAELAGVSTSLADGPSHAFWFYDFQSPSTGSCTRIRALASGRTDNVGPGESCILMKPVPAAFVDSPVAWDAARAAGFTPGESVQFGLRFQRDEALGEPRACWVLWSDDDGDDAGLIRGWCVDPATGSFVARLSGTGRIEPLQ
ncbi:MAG: hypothetical protein KJ041_00590 [Gammaproteobacteria bacterium]|nr:hypothetical protein [Gammaproteobacteria bacterium]